MSSPNPAAGVILVAERFNKPYAFSRPRGWWLTPEAGNGIRWLSLSRRLGCFRRGAGASRLKSLGLRWDASCNLTPPDLQGQPFDVALADQVAALIRDMAWWRIILVGGRVRQSFGFDGAVRYGHLYEQRYVCVPHPSGLCRWWNHSLSGVSLGSPLTIVQELVDRALDEELGDYLCRTCEHPVDPLLDLAGLCPACEERRRGA